jgi:orotate phosphoribosyltransferase
MRQEEVLALLRKSDAMLEGHFELTSGLHSDRYFQCALVLMDPARAERLAREWVAGAPGEIDVVVGPALGAVIWAHELARALGVRALFTERKDGAMSLRRGFTIAPNERVLVVEDVVTTGGSAQEVLDLVRSLGGRPAGVGALVNRSGGNPFAAQGLGLRALAEVEAKTWQPAQCPLCARGDKAIKPGSRSVASASGGGKRA